MYVLDVKADISFASDKVQGSKLASIPSICLGRKKTKKNLHLSSSRFLLREGSFRPFRDLVGAYAFFTPTSTETRLDVLFRAIHSCSSHNLLLFFFASFFSLSSFPFSLTSLSTFSIPPSTHTLSYRVHALTFLPSSSIPFPPFFELAAFLNCVWALRVFPPNLSLSPCSKRLGRKWFFVFVSLRPILSFFLLSCLCWYSLFSSLSYNCVIGRWCVSTPI